MLFPIRLVKSDKKESVTIRAGLTSELNLLVFAHLIFFLLYITAESVGLLEYPLSQGSLADFIRANLGLSYRIGELQSNWWISIFTFQFVHSDVLEFLLSMGILWFFGHILKHHIGERKVIVLYFACTALAGIVFLTSRLAFKIFSAGAGMMEGAFSGSLGVMTAAAILAGSYHLQLGSRLVSVWKLSAVLGGLYLLSFYQHNMAYILVVVFSLYAGYRYAFSRLRSADTWSNVEVQSHEK